MRLFCATRIYAALFAVTAAAILALPAWAQEDGIPIVIANRVACRLRDPGKEGGLVQRETGVNKQITEAFASEDVGHPNIRIDYAGKNPGIYIGKTFLVYVYPGDAAPNGVTQKQLAQTWAHQFKVLFPLAEPVIHMEDPFRLPGEGGSQLPPPEKKEVDCAEQDQALVADLGGLFRKARPLTNEEFEEQKADVLAEAMQLIWDGSKQEGDPQQPPACEPAQYSVYNGFRYCRQLPEEYFDAERDPVAYT